MGETLDQFLKAVRRRMCAARIVRASVIGASLATGILFGCIIASLVTSVRLPTWPAFAAVPIAAISALVRRRPSPLAVARHVDDAMQLRDLLSSAVAVRERRDDVSVATVSMAEGVVAVMDARRVPVGMPSTNAAIAAILLLGLIAVCWLLAAPPASTPRFAAAAGNDAVSNRAPATRSDSGTPAAMRERRDPEQREAAARSEAADLTAGSSPSADNSTRSEQGTADAEGRSHASTPDARAVGGADFAAGEATSVALNSSSGGAGKRDAAGAPAGIAQSVTEGELERRAIDSSHGFAASQRRAGDALARGAVPVDRRDLVRAYFDLPDALR